MNIDFSPRVGQSVADSEIVTNAEYIFSPKKLVRRKTQTDKVLIRWDLLKAGPISPNSKKWGRRWGCTLFHTNHCRVKGAEAIHMLLLLLKTSISKHDLKLRHREKWGGQTLKKATFGTFCNQSHGLRANAIVTLLSKQCLFVTFRPVIVNFL